MNNNERLEVKKMSALLELGIKTGHYAKEHIDERVIAAIYEKKSKLIQNAETCEELQTIMNGPKPFDDSGLTVPEEEMIMWSEASLKAPLNKTALDRYISLMKSFYGEKMLKECGVC